MPVDKNKAANKKILQERAKRYAVNSNALVENHELMIAFMQADTRYAVSLSLLMEIRPLMQLTVLPLISPLILGLMNVRGRVLPVYQFKQTKDCPVCKFALVGCGVAEHLALAADEIIGAIEVQSEAIKPAPLTLSEDYVRGVGSDGTVFIDLEKLITNKKFYQA